MLTTRTRPYRGYRITVLEISGGPNGIVYAPDGTIVEEEIEGAGVQEVIVKAMRLVDDAIAAARRAADD